MGWANGSGVENEIWNKDKQQEVARKIAGVINSFDLDTHDDKVSETLKPENETGDVIHEQNL